MDQKQTLWIVAAAGVFLLVVFGFAAIWSAPSAEPARTIASSSNSTSNNGWTSNPETNKSSQYAPPAENTSDDLANLDTQDTENELQDEKLAEALKDNSPVTQIADMTVISQNTTIYELPANKVETTIEVSPSANRTSNVTATNQAGADALATARGDKAATATTSRTQATASTNTVTSTPKSATTTTKPAAATSTKPTATASVRTADTKTATTQYWVQAASFTSKKSADNAVVVLDSNMIPANIFTYQDPKGTLYYRIRVGPYVTKSEAEYWQTKIAKIDTFSDTKSYVTATTSTR